MRIGKLEIPQGAVFAPMAGFTDAACRHLMADHGAAYTVSEMASAKAITYGDQKSVALLRDKDPHGIYAVQLFGNEPDILAQAIHIIRDKGLTFDIIDINMGCPAPKITGSGAGSKLMLDPELCGRMVRAAVDAAGEIPVTVKMRAGWDADHITAVEVARQCQQNGAALVTVHGRTREQMYIPPIDPGIIRAVKQAVSIPVVGNGDINSADDALALMQQTGCDAVMVGRGALGNPWLFEEIRAALTGQPAPQPPQFPHVRLHGQSLAPQRQHQQQPRDRGPPGPEKGPRHDPHQGGDTHRGEERDQTVLQQCHPKSPRDSVCAGADSVFRGGMGEISPPRGNGWAAGRRPRGICSRRRPLPRGMRPPFSF